MAMRSNTDIKLAGMGYHIHTEPRLVIARIRGCEIKAAAQQASPA
jgi:hypothetical protein